MTGNYDRAQSCLTNNICHQGVTYHVIMANSCLLGADFVVSYLAVVIDFFLKFKREIKLNIDVFLVR